MLLHPVRTFKMYAITDWATKTMILLYMKTTEGTLKFVSKRRWTNPWSRKMGATLEDGVAPTANIPEAAELANAVAKQAGGTTGAFIAEGVTNIPTTAHILGGCAMGANAEEGVIDAQHRVFGYDGLYVVDGSAISANPGVNPSLTILALAERAMSFIPAKDVAPSKERSDEFHETA